MCFNPRTHEGCDSEIWLNGNPLVFQSTHPRGVRPYLLQALSLRDMVSIHAPTRGATSRQIFSCVRLAVSIHAPTRGATLDLPRFGRIIFSFNPRTHEGCDFVPFQCLWRYFVSIHAPTRGATCTHEEVIYRFYVSIHAPTRGATMLFAASKIATMFQSTHPRGVRRIVVSVLLPPFMFQSTHPRGVRLQYSFN